MQISKRTKRTKYKEIYEYLHQQISAGTYKPGSQIPTEEQLAASFSTSRPTVSRALRDLETTGLIYRIQGCGSFISERKKLSNITLGLLGPKEVFTPSYSQALTVFNQIVSPISAYASQNDMALILGNSPQPGQRNFDSDVLKVCDDLIDRDVQGVFFVLFEPTKEGSSLNERIAQKFHNSRIPMVLLDSDIYNEMYRRSRYDIVGLDNIRASYIATRHLIGHGCRKMCILSEEAHNNVVNDRIQGYRQALRDNNISGDSVLLPQYNKATIDQIRSMVLSLNADGIVCVNDRLAAMVLSIYSENNRVVPSEVKVVGFDDLPLSDHLVPPLTTIRQPVDALARESVRTMLSRIEGGDEPAKDIKIHGELIVRRSCGC